MTQTIIDKKTGTVTFFAFDQGQGLREHTAPFDALAYLLGGEAEVVISGRPPTNLGESFRKIAIKRMDWK